MTAVREIDPRRIRLLAWGGAAALILLPLLGLKASNTDAWEVEDLPFALMMIAAVGISFEIALRIPNRWSRLGGTSAALATAFLLMWGNLAVGFAGSEENHINVIFFAAPLVALVGSFIARFRSAGVAIALVAAAVAQIAAGVIALFDGHFTMPLTVSFTGFWLASALLFRRSARELATDQVPNRQKG